MVSSGENPQIIFRQSVINSVIKRHPNSQDDLQTYTRVFVVAVEEFTRNGLSNAIVSQLAELYTDCLWRNQALSNRLQYARHFTAVVKQELISAGASYAKISNTK